MNTRRFASLLGVVIICTSCDLRPSRKNLVGAAAREDFAAVKELIGQGVNINERDRLTGQTALIAAAYFGHTEVVELLLRAGADPNLQDKDGHTALIMAMYGDDENTNLIRMLLRAGANPLIKDSHGATALGYASALPPRPGILRVLEEEKSAKRQEPSPQKRQSIK